MEIHILDWIIYFLILWIFKREDDLVGIESVAFFLLYTLLYCLIFYYFNWWDIFQWIYNNTKINL